jgi:V/A-type H+-transporting ATPase subunit I
MKKTSIIVHQSYLDEAIKILHEEGIMQISEISEEEAEDELNLTPSPLHPETTLCIQYEQRLRDLIKILKKHQKKKTGIKSLLNPELPSKQIIEDISIEDLYSDIESTFSDHEKNILKKHHRLEDINNRIETLNNFIEDINKFTSFNIYLKDIGISSSLIIRAGITDQLIDIQKSCSSVELSELYSKQITKGKKPLWAVILIGHISEKKEIEQIGTQFITELDLPYIDSTPKEAIVAFNKEKNQLQAERKDIISSLKKTAIQHLFNLRILHEQIRIERIRKEINQQFAQTQTTILIKGWVQENHCSRLKDLMETVTHNHVVVDFESPSPNPDIPPTYMKTPAWAEGFKTLVELFAIPRYNEINPTIIMGIFFVIFFGVMLGDAGYGIILLLLSLVGYIKFGKYSPTIKHWSFMGIWLGVVTTLVGFLTYSIFGNLVHMIVLNDSSTALLYQFTLMGIHFPIDSLTDPIAILTMALILGLIHLNIGIILGIYQAYKRKHYKVMFTEKLCWIPLQIGGGLLIGLFILDWKIPNILISVSIILVIIGFIQLLIASGPVGFFDITGYVGDWLSYARLLALGLATAGMALAFNVVSKLLGEMIPYVGIIITILLLFVLHIVNLAISALGAGVHSLRLQYVEFFNRFYEGGGTMFSPFQIKRIYTQIKKDKTP